VLTGQRVEDRPPRAGAGRLLWIHVDDMTAALDGVATRGGEVFDPGVDPVGLAGHLRSRRR